MYNAGADPGFQVRGAHLKKLRRAKNFGVFRVKNHDFTPKNHIFSNFSPPPGSTPAMCVISTGFVLLLPDNCGLLKSYILRNFYYRNPNNPVVILLSR